MKFTVSTKPLKNVTNLGIIKANISKYYYRSNVVQITASRDTLKINIEATGIRTRMTLRGSGDSDVPASVMVDCSKFKTLLDSIENDIMSLEFADGGLYIHAGNSKFAIPQMLDIEDVQLDEPSDQYTGADPVVINPANWQFIKEHQLYAIATKEERPVYTNVWIGKNHDVIVGDMDLGLFAFSKKGDFDNTCLFPTSLVNLFASIPAGSTVTKIGRNYLLNITTDSYSLVTEFTPKYEDDESVGSYNSEIILGRSSHPESYITVDLAPIVKFINQTAILKQDDLDKVLEFNVKEGKLSLVNKYNTCTLDVATVPEYILNFRTDLLKSVLSNFDMDRINIAAVFDEKGTPVGCTFWTDNLTTVLAGTKVI